MNVKTLSDEYVYILQRIAIQYLGTMCLCDEN